MKAKFSGHDTFPLRYGWLNKAVNYLNFNGKLQTADESKIREAIIDLGVGKNMVSAIRYWAEATGVIHSVNMGNLVDHSASDNGIYLFGERDRSGKDPYLEHVGSVWLIHFWLNFNCSHLTAYRYFFNYSNVQHFEKTKLLADCSEDVGRLVTNSPGNENTLRKDIDCFLNTYCKKFKKPSKKKEIFNEDSFTSPLAELKLIHDNGNGFYISNLGEQEELPIAIFIYGLIKFTQLETEDSKVNSIDFDSLLTKPYSPGRIFRLSESGLGQKLDEAQEFSKGQINWIDSLGLRQINVDQESLTNEMAYLDKYYERIAHEA
jgi:hypothetical protein